MITAYMAEVDTGKDTMFIGEGGKLKQRPKMFSHSAAMLRALLKFEKYYVSKDLKEKVSVIVVRDLQKGIRASSADLKSSADFKASIVAKKPRVKSLRDAQYKIELSSEAQSRLKQTMYGGGTDAKFGKTWKTAGDVRRFITSNIDLLKNVLEDATVIEYSVKADGITPAIVIRHPIVVFYRGSPDSDKRYHQFFGTSLSQELPKFRSELA